MNMELELTLSAKGGDALLYVEVPYCSGLPIAQPRRDHSSVLGRPHSLMTL
jgi:hypothetical protein